ncbi:hypothetical protein L873DRAFT_598479 [Choiromyces venosus 120613-1]|uniref:Carbohydrate-binding module family 19 domain-containing protein n=1 Tax=Choiromyces venosus 120613-1 TaxID=1336337 RepID=A0A3N4JTR1_9PEZI|nr:hypothetical protein L873DRAFT_598479 [Choiromyces venosus 120613-1]
MSGGVPSSIVSEPLLPVFIIVVFLSSRFSKDYISLLLSLYSSSLKTTYYFFHFFFLFFQPNMKITFTTALIALQFHAVIAGPIYNNPALKPRDDDSLYIKEQPGTTRTFRHFGETKAPVANGPSSASVAEPSSSLRLPVGTRTTTSSSSSSSSSVVSSSTNVPGTRSFRRPPEDTPKPKPSSEVPVPPILVPPTPVPSAPTSSSSSPTPFLPAPSSPAPPGTSAPTSDRTFVRPTPPRPSSSSKAEEKPSAPATVTVTVTASARPPPAAPTTSPTPTTTIVPTTLVPTTSRVPTTSATATTSATPTTSQKASQAPSGSQPPSSANSNTALAIAQNKKFAALTTASPCDPKNPSQLHACIAGNFHTCGNDGKYAKVIDCVAPLTCFALPLEQSAGVSIACVTPSEAASRMGFSSEEELKGAIGKRSLARRNAEEEQIRAVIAQNKRFLTLKPNAACNSQDRAARTACIDGALNQCGQDNKYYKVLDCQTPTK